MVLFWGMKCLVTTLQLVEVTSSLEKIKCGDLPSKVYTPFWGKIPQMSFRSIETSESTSDEIVSQNVSS